MRASGLEGQKPSRSAWTAASGVARFGRRRRSPGQEKGRVNPFPAAEIRRRRRRAKRVVAVALQPQALGRCS